MDTVWLVGLVGISESESYYNLRFYSKVDLSDATPQYRSGKTIDRQCICEARTLMSEIVGFFIPLICNFMDSSLVFGSANGALIASFYITDNLQDDLLAFKNSR